MNDLISRQAAIVICRAPHMRNADCSDFEMAIMMLPPEQPERNTGEWITNLYAFGEDRYECDQCHNTALHCYDFCPNCGADMRGEQDGRFNQQTGGD